MKTKMKIMMTSFKNNIGVFAVKQFNHCKQFEFFEKNMIKTLLIDLGLFHKDSDVFWCLNFVNYMTEI